MSLDATSRDATTRHSEDVMRELTAFTPAEVAQMLGASEWWVRDHAMRRKVPHLRLGRGKIMFRESDVVTLMESIVVEPVEEADSDPAGERQATCTGVALHKVREVRDAALVAGLSTRAANRMARSAG